MPTYQFRNKETGEIIKFLSKDFEKKIEEDPELKEAIYQEICDNYILRYKPGEDIGIDDVVVDLQTKTDDITEEVEKVKGN